ncbi:putative polyketide synthase, partial [Aureobasidium melanogenum]
MMTSIDTPTSSESDDGSRKMDLVYFSNDFPKDDLQTLFRHLRNQSKTRQHTILAHFLATATSSLKHEIQALSAELKQSFRPFESLLDWADDAELRRSSLCGAVDGVLLVILQLGAYIGFVEDNPDKFLQYPEANITALGVGLLSAAAVSASTTLPELASNSSNAVFLAFRMGIYVQNISKDLDVLTAENTDSWAYVVQNVDLDAVNKELGDWNQDKGGPMTGKIFVSAYGGTSVTISGPPSRLTALVTKSHFFRTARYMALPVYGGLCHAPHIYGADDVQKLMSGINWSAIETSTLPLYSTSSGRPYPACNFSGMIEHVLSELLTQAICWDSVVAGVSHRIRSPAVSTLSLYCLGNSLPLHELKTALVDTVSSLEISTELLTTWIYRPTNNDSAPRSAGQSKLAIVGMSCRLPGGATDIEKFWKLLEDGLDVSRQIPADRFDVETHYDPTGSQLNKSMTQYGCFIDQPGMFDASFFNMSPREAQTVDPQMRLALVTAYEALEQAGCVGDRTAATQLQRVGTWYGQAADDYREVNQGQSVSTYYIPGGCRAFGPGRINYFFKFAGPSYSVDTACSSGLAAIEVACQALWNGEVDTAIAGGLNVLTNPDGFAGLCNGHFLTKGHNACKTWDATADGYCRADAIGSVVIKRLEDAEADNDNILGVILGAGTNHSAQAVSITHPHAGHQADLSRQILRKAGVDPLDVSYVELHGTGTQAGDHEEMKGIMDVYAPLAKRRRNDQPLYVGAVKSNVGHSESGAGTTALIKVLLMLQKNAIPRHIGIKTEMNSIFANELGKRNMHVPFEQTAWHQDPAKKRLAVVNNFGAAGGNTTMLLEEGPSRSIPQADLRGVYPVLLSAKTKYSLGENIARMIKHIELNPDLSIASLSYTTTARRLQHSYRYATAVSNIGSLKKKLAAYLDKIEALKPLGKSAKPQIAFTFTGQGASHKSMSLQLYRDLPTFRESIQQLDDLAKIQGFPSFVPALDGSHDKDHLHSPVVTQLALVCTEIALTKYWETLGVKPDVVCGHSLGEYAAMHAAGIISASEAIFMVGRRAEMLTERCQSGSHIMMAVRASTTQIEELSAGKVYTVACINGPSDTVLSGTKQQMEDMQRTLEASGFRCILLDVAFAFHSEQTDPILDDFEVAAKGGVIFREPKLPILSPLLGRVVFDSKTINAKYVRQATRETVNFVSALESAHEASAISDETIWIEIGPHPVCTSFVKSTLATIKLAVPSLHRIEDNWKTISETLAALILHGVDVRWQEFHRPFEQNLRLLNLPAYAWDEKNYWLQYQGDWCLTKGNDFYTTTNQKALPQNSLASEVQTSTVQSIINANFDGAAGTVTMESDLMQADFLAAAHGHRMNDCGVVTSSIHADIAYTLGQYLLKKSGVKTSKSSINITELDVTKGLVAQKDTKTPQRIRVTISAEDMISGLANMTWCNVDNSGVPQEPFATATLVYGNPSEWLSSWTPLSHLIESRIDSLTDLANKSQASRFTGNMAYTLFASNLVDYAEKYRGMQSVVLRELEAFADVQLTAHEGGVWTVPPYFIDSVAHLAGFIMNCSDAMDTHKNFCVTPGWKSMRFAKPLVAGMTYRSYVKMIPTPEDATVYTGDVYIMQEGQIIGLVGGIKFRRYPRLLLSRFFSAPDKANSSVPQKTSHAVSKASEPSSASQKPSTEQKPKPVPSVKQEAPMAVANPAAMKETASSPTIVDRALELIAKEAGLDITELKDDADFADLGVDSLMSLVITEKFKTTLDVVVGGSLFLDYPSIGDLRGWLESSYG